MTKRKDGWECRLPGGKVYGCKRLCEDCQKPVTATHCPKCFECSTESKRQYRGWNDRPSWGGCHEWNGYMAGGGKGGGKFQSPAFKKEGQTKTVRREIWECLIGEIPDNLVVRVTCGNNKCIWINHLVLSNSKLGSPRVPGDRFQYDDGYVHVVQESGRSKLEHHIVMEEALGREFYPGENVHHINGVKEDNRLENLELWATSQPSGQRVEDILEWAHEMIRRYEPKVEEESRYAV